VEISYRQKVCLAFFQPVSLGHRLTFGAVPVPAGVIADSFESTPVTFFNMAAESRRSTIFNISHHLAV
jgi:hypothetical protein